MKKFLFKILIFLIPIFLVTFTLTLVVDPYNYFNFFKIIPDSEKINNLPRYNKYLWTLIEYKNKPGENIILGDSRSARIDVDYVYKLTGHKYSNLSLEGANAATIKSSFFFAANTIKLKRVYIGISFNSFSQKGGDPYNQIIGDKRVDNLIDKINNPLYFINDEILKQSANLVIKHFSRVDIKKAAVLPFNKDNQWNYFLLNYGDNIFKDFILSEKYLEDLREITDYCRFHNIYLAFIIFPNHIDLHNKIREYGLDATERQFKTNIRKLGPVYDYDYYNDITNNKNNYEDPFHSTKLVTDLLTKEIWSNKLE